MSTRPTAMLLTVLLAACPALAQSVSVVVARNGSATIDAGRHHLASIAAGFADTGWSFSSQDRARAGDPDPDGARRGTLDMPDGATVEFATLVTPAPRGFRARYSMRPSAALDVNSVHVALSMPAAGWAGSTWKADEATGTIPVDTGPTTVFSGRPAALTLRRPDGVEMTLSCPSGQGILLQDSRQWGPAIDIRVGQGAVEGNTWAANAEVVIEVDVSFNRDVDVQIDEPVVLAPSDEWIETEGALDIVPGSALDWSDQGLADPPAGRYGRVVVGPSGHFEFADRPGRPVRFWGCNLCFSALYPDHDVADRLATRLRMLGYNAVRIHHYESGMQDRNSASSMPAVADSIDRLDYLIAALKRNGIYVTTDLYVSRGVRASEIWPGAEGNVEMDEYKMLVLVNDSAVENLKEFARAFMGHANPYTGTSLAGDAVLAHLSIINEGNAGNFVNSLPQRTAREWQAAFNRWLLDRYASRQRLADAWHGLLRENEDPVQGTVALAGGDARATDRTIFCAELQRKLFRTVKSFLHDELGCDVPLTDMNSWTDTLANHAVRAEWDYVDGHFYWDHPAFLERAWSLPSRGWSNGESATAAGGAGARDRAVLRVLGKPFTVTEFNFTAPNRYRSEGGLLMGAVAALQAWDGVYRFAYSHSRDNLSEARPLGYFDLASDPLSLASDRAAILLFTRGDMRPAPHTVAMRIDPAAPLAGSGTALGLEPPLRTLAFVTGVGSQLGDGPADLAFAATPGVEGVGLGGDPYAAGAAGDVVAAMRQRGWLAQDNPTDLRGPVLASETGELVLDAPAATVAISTERFAAAFAADAGVPVAAGPLRATFDESGGAVWVASLDGKPVTESSRLVVAHLTDLQNTGPRFDDAKMLTLRDWGRMPYLVRKGTARISLRTAANLTVWALALDGSRAAEVTVASEAGGLTFAADTRGPKGGCLYYELAAR